MNLKKVLTKDSIRLNIPGKTKREIIEALVDVITETGKVQDREAVLSAVLKREEQMSTGMKHGIAIPHGKTDAVKDLIACVAVSENGIDFESLDDIPARIFVMTISPSSHSGPHLEFLAEVSDLLKREDLRERVLLAKTQDELYEILLNTKK